nr:Integration host factor subunit alpha [Klebsiella pneumoniae]
MALTKAEMSEYLFDKLGLSKRDAKELVELFSKRSVVLWKTENRSNSPGSATSICGIKPTPGT